MPAITDDNDGNDDVVDADARRIIEERVLFNHFVAWCGVVLVVLLFGLGWLVFTLNGNVEDLEVEVENVERAANNADEAASRAADDLADALAQAENNEGISTAELRSVFALVEDIKIVVCESEPNLDECQESEP